MTHDFGFSTYDEDDPALEVNVAKDQQVSDLINRLNAMYDLLYPLVNGLYTTSDQPIIKWPDRDKELGKVLNKMAMLRDGNANGL